MMDTFLSHIAVSILIAFEVLIAIMKFVVTNWLPFTIAILLGYFILKNTLSIYLINKRLEWSDSNVREEVKNVLNERFNYSMTNIYSEKGVIGHEWTYMIDDEHWVTTVYDEATGKMKVKHFRTHKNIEQNSYEKRMQEDVAHNKEFIYGNERAAADVSGMENHNGIYIPKKK